MAARVADQGQTELVQTAGQRLPRDVSSYEIIAITLFAMAGAIVQGSIGVGLALVAGPALLAIDPGFAPGPLLLAGQVVGIRHVIAERDETDQVACRRCMIGLPVGLIGGLAVLTLFSERDLALLVGGLTMVAAAALLAGVKLSRTPRVEMVGGAACTFASVTAGLPGPPLVIAFNDMKPASMRGTASTFVLMVAAIGMMSLVISGNYGGDEVKLTLWLLPGIGLGIIASRWVRPYLEKSWFRPLVLVIAFCGGLALVLRQVL